MTPLSHACLLAAVLAAAGPAHGSEAGPRDLTWRTCLERSFAGHAALTGREPAADAALRACRGAEDAYLAALAGSPLLDDADIARTRPALAARARARLLGRAAPRRTDLRADLQTDPRTGSR